MSDIDATKRDYEIALAHHQSGRLAEAAKIYQAILSVDANHLASLHNLGLIIMDSGNPAHAATLFSKALELKPDYARAYNSLGSAQYQMGQLEDAARSYRQSLTLNPEDPLTHYNLGNALNASGDEEEALACFREALRLNPADLDSNINIGTVLLGLTRFEEALAHLENLVYVIPDYAEAHYNVGVALERLGRSPEAEMSFQKALAINPDYGDAHFGISSMLLERGELERGWQEYEWRVKKEAIPTATRNFPQARWNGEDLQGKSILIWGEQGIGDEIRFASIIPDILDMAGDCAIECEPRLVDLFARSFPEARVHAAPYTEAEWGADAFDYQIPTPSLPLYLRSSIEDFPDRTSYLVADPERQKYWRARMDALGDGLKIGVSWRSLLSTPMRRRTFATIADLAPLLDLKDVVFINLQYGQCADEVAEFEELYGVPLHNWDDIDLKDDIDDAVALTACLDVVVTLLSAVYEMSGALGIPTYTFHPPSGCSITLGTDHIPFHPSVRFYKCRVDESWQRVLSEITEEIGK